MTRPKSGSKSESKKLPKPKEVEWSDSLLVAVQKLAFGNGRAGALLARIVNTMHEEAMEFLWTMGQLNLYGDSIIDGFESVCHGDRDWFVASILTRDNGFLREVEREKVRKAAGILNIKHLVE